jgi:hypothetical protein
MLTIDADYIGGDPDVVGLIGAAGTLGEEDGVFTFRQTTVDAGALMSSSGKKAREEMRYGADEVLTVVTGDANQMRMLTRLAVGDAIGGGIGGLIGASGGKRNQELALVVRRDGFDFIATFRVSPDDARRFIDTLQRERRERGLGPLPSAEDALGVSAAPSAGTDAEVLVDIRTLLQEQNDLLRAVLHELGSQRA